MSFFNAGETHLVTQIVSGLLRIPSITHTATNPDEYFFPRPEGGVEDVKQHLKPAEISVISPFREQVWSIRVALRAMGLGAVDVGDVESLQGAEKCVDQPC